MPGVDGTYHHDDDNHPDFSKIPAFAQKKETTMEITTYQESKPLQFIAAKDGNDHVRITFGDLKFLITKTAAKQMAAQLMMATAESQITGSYLDR